MRPPQENRPLAAAPKVTANFDWKENLQLEYTQAKLHNGKDWMIKTLSNGSYFNDIPNDLPIVTPEQLNHLQRRWYHMTLDAVATNTQLLLIVDGTAGTGKSHTIAAISASLGHGGLARAAFPAKAAYSCRNPS